MDVSIPAVMPDIQMASGRLLKTVERATLARSRPPRYTAASGVMLKNSLTFCPSTARWWRMISPQLGAHKPKSLAYAPVKISRTKLALVATARSMQAVGSQMTLTP